MCKLIKKTAVIGAGTIGAGWATLFAAKGCSVNLYSRRAETRAHAFQTLRSNLSFLVKKGLMTEDEMDSAFKRVNDMTSITDAVKDVDYAQESVAEEYDLKKRIFEEMDAVCPEHAILASSSSGLLMTEIQKATTRPERCIIAHPFNPPHLIPLVEIVPGKKTSEETVRATYDFHSKLGKVPVILKAEIPGYIANRVAAALWREAIDLVDKGVASVEDVDKAVYAGPGIRWALMGSHLTYHLGGGAGGIGHFIDHIGRTTFKTLWEDLATWTWISDSAKGKLIEGVKEEMGARTLDDLVKWRDDKLVELLKIIYERK